MLSDEVLHDDPVESDVSACKHLLAGKLGTYELFELVLVARLDLGQETIVRCLPEVS